MSITSSSSLNLSFAMKGEFITIDNSVLVCPPAQKKDLNMSGNWNVFFSFECNFHSFLSNAKWLDWVSLFHFGSAFYKRTADKRQK